MVRARSKQAGERRRTLERIAGEAARAQEDAARAGLGFLVYLVGMVKVEAEAQRDSA
jgi:hypothetical protein